MATRARKRRRLPGCLDDGPLQGAYDFPRCHVGNKVFATVAIDEASLAKVGGAPQRLERSSGDLPSRSVPKPEKLESDFKRKFDSIMKQHQCQGGDATLLYVCCFDARAFGVATKLKCLRLRKVEQKRQSGQERRSLGRYADLPIGAPAPARFSACSDETGAEHQSNRMFQTARGARQYFALL